MSIRHFSYFMHGVTIDSVIQTVFHGTAFLIMKLKLCLNKMDLTKFPY